MKELLFILLKGFAALFILCALPSTLFSQGSLTPPPGPPAPAMKTLDQIDVHIGQAGEKRTPISSLPFTISAPGSYYLTAPLTTSTGAGITINASGVTLDLSGFTLTSTASPAAGIAIGLGNVHDVSIGNGHIVGGVNYNGTVYSAGPGFANGITYTTGNPPATAPNILVQNVSVTGCSSSGINLVGADGTTVDHCIVSIIAGRGISAGNVANSTASTCASTGIVATNVQNSSGSSTSGAGLLAVNGATNCSGTAASNGTGLSALSAMNCVGRSDSGIGLSANVAQNCLGSSSSGTGVFAINAMNCSGSTGSGIGIDTGNQSVGGGVGTGGVASYCHAEGGSGTGIKSFLVIGCTANVGNGGTQFSYSGGKYLQP